MVVDSLAVLVVVTHPGHTVGGTGLIAALGHQVEKPVGAHHDLDSPAVGGVGMEDIAGIVAIEYAEAGGLLARVTLRPVVVVSVPFRHLLLGEGHAIVEVEIVPKGRHPLEPPAHTFLEGLDLAEGRARDGDEGHVPMGEMHQGASGMIVHPVEFLQKVRALCTQYDVLLIADEVLTGFGRTGTMFACEHAGVAPDIITLSKALTGGTLPLAATIATPMIFDAFWSDDPKKALMHGPTYMANALGCAAANASLDLFEREPRLRQVADIAIALEQGLAPCRDFPNVKDVRVKGAIGVVELDRIDALDALRTQFIEQGVFIRPIGNVIYLTPAFTISSDELQTLTDAIVKTVRKMKQ